MATRITLILGMVLLGVSYSSAGHHHGWGHAAGHGHGGGGGGDVGGGAGFGGGHDGGHGGWGHDHYATPHYKYSYGVSDKKTGDEKMASEWRDGHNVKGQYSLKEADGSWRTVTYVSDDKGFRANVHRTHG